MSDPRPLRIGHVTATFPPYYGGTGNVCFHNARVLAESGHDVHVFTARWPGTTTEPPGVTVHRLRPYLRIGNALALPGLIGGLRGFDIVHLHYPFIGGGEFAATMARLRRTPLIVTYHNDLIAPGPRGALFGAYERTAGAAILAMARRVGVVTAGYVEGSRLLQGVTRAAHRLVEIPNGVDTSRFRPHLDGGPIRRRFGIPPDAFVVLYVGGLDAAHYFKRVDLLLHAIATTGRGDVWGLIVGGGDLQPGLQALAAQLGLTDHVRFAGSVAHDDVPPYFAAADLLVLPSVAVESFGIVLVEAMACGRPVVASDLPGVRSLVAHEQDGLLVPPGDVAALSGALSAFATMPPAERTAMGMAGRDKVQATYDWTQIGERLACLYTEVLAESAGSQA